MKRRLTGWFGITAFVLVFSTTFGPSAFGQATGALSGTVGDQTGALIPGVDVTAVNAATNVQTTVITTGAGAYNFPAMQPGTYTVSASLSGFQTQTFTDVAISANTTNRLNFELSIAQAATDVEVSLSAAQLLLESSPSAGGALEENEIVNLPNVTNNVLELVTAMAGVTRQTEGFVLGLQADFAGVSANNMNIVRDGISVNDQRWSSAGLNAATYMNPDMIGEMKMVLAPVDAETGRGSGQVQVTTRSGGNEFHGAAVWNIRNSALDARTWADNRTAGGPPTIPWINQNQYTISAGGPIVSNRTFYYVLWDQNISKSRTTTQGQALSACMQKGIFRYWDNWDNGAADSPTNSGGNNPIRPSVDAAGLPLAPLTNPDGSQHNQILRHVSLFGQVSGTPTPDCSGMTVGPAPTSSGAWDPLRNEFDTSGVYDLLASRAPEGNSWEQGPYGGTPLDGLNVIGHRWVRTVDGRDNLFGVGEPNPRKQINIKIDHIFSQNHKIAGSYSYETVNADDTYEGWQDSFEGRLRRRPQVMSINMTSTLKPTMVNEGRFGMSRMGTNVLHATSVYGDQLIDLLPKTTGGLPVLTQWCTPAGFLQPVAITWCGENGGLVGARGNGPSATDTIDSSPRWTVADTLSWTTGAHALRFGVTYIRATSKSEVTGSSINDHSFPVVFLGSAPLAPNNAFDQNGPPEGWRALNPSLSPGLVTNNSGRMRDLLLFLSGSLGSIEQGRFINSPTQVGGAWNDPIAGDLVSVRDLQQNEFSVFAKDDWKVTDDLTLNLGMRWDYYGVPWDKNGMAMTVVNGGNGLFGRTGDSFDDWLLPPAERGFDTEFIFVGPNSPNPELSVYNRDLNNFGPAVGFAYSIPWLGRDRTVLRGGYQLSYLGGGAADTISGIIENPPGSAVQAVFSGNNGGEYFNMQDVVDGVGVPVAPTALPVEPVPVTDRGVSLTVFAPDYATPYVQNLTASITHTFNSTLTLDVKYIGTLSRKLATSQNLNFNNLFQNGLFDALETARAGGESQLLDDIFNGINMRTSFFGPDQIVGTNGLTGAELLRTDTRWSNNLANGNFTSIAGNLNDLNYSNTYNDGTGGNPSHTQITDPNSNGWVLRENGFPENFIVTNPQFNNANLRSTMLHSNYHSLQAQLTIRPIWGVQNTLSYTWSKDLRDSGSPTIPWMRSLDYQLAANGRQHVLQSYGTFSLPLGPNQLLLRNSSGWVARAAEGWQISWIYSASSGRPGQVSAARSGYYANNYPVLVGSFDTDGQVSWPGGDQFGSYFSGYDQALDPQCTDSAVVDPSIQGLCTLNALYSSNGDLVFRTTLPGELSNFRDQIFLPGRWDLDMALSKNTQILENLSWEVRVDATNVFNHPHPADPNLSIQGGGSQFGTITSKNGTDVQFAEFGRVFQLRSRLTW